MSSGLQVLEAFIIEAKSVRSVEELCELVAATAVRLTGADHAMTWIADRGVLASVHHVGCAGLEAGPAKEPTEWPELIERAMTTEASGRQMGVQRGELGLPSGAPFTSVDWVTARRGGAQDCWLGVLSSCESGVPEPVSISGPMILCITGQMMARPSGHSISLMISLVNAWRSE